MSLRLHEIAEGNHRILNPFTEDKLRLLGEICRLKPGMRQLDLACGKGEMLCQWARRWSIGGIGVDISPVFLAAAKQRAAELSVADRVTFLEADAGHYIAEAAKFDVVSCLGATWIGGGLVGTLRLMSVPLKADGLLLVGEPYWITPPPDEAYHSSGIGGDDFTSLLGTLDRIESAGLELVEMVLASPDNWDRYVAAQWWTVNEWAKNNAGDPNSPVIHEWIAHSRRDYLAYERQHLGWGVFVIKRQFESSG
ncbi:MAG: SAM-dependent methyltransferase [Aggregatilineales bacterium]